MANQTEFKEKSLSKLKRPKLYKVMLHNDNYTTMEFVTEILMNVFHKKHMDAVKIMRDVHEKGIGIVGVYPYDIAYTKIILVEQMSKDNDFPLRITMEEE